MPIPEINALLPGHNLTTRGLKIVRNGLNNENAAFISEYLHHSCHWLQKILLWHTRHERLHEVICYASPGSEQILAESPQSLLRSIFIDVPCRPSLPWAHPLPWLSFLRCVSLRKFLPGYPPLLLMGYRWKPSGPSRFCRDILLLSWWDTAENHQGHQG